MAEIIRSYIYGSSAIYIYRLPTGFAYRIDGGEMSHARHTTALAASLAADAAVDALVEDGPASPASMIGDGQAPLTWGDA